MSNSIQKKIIMHNKILKKLQCTDELKQRNNLKEVTKLMQTLLYNQAPKFSFPQKILKNLFSGSSMKDDLSTEDKKISA